MTPIIQVYKGIKFSKIKKGFDDLIFVVENLKMRKAELTPREEEVVALMAKGLIDKEIAQELKISMRTVQAYNIRIYIKLGAKNRPHAVANYIRSLHSKNL